jgi:hypothetical protein
MVEATIRVPVPREFLLRTGLAEGDEQEMVLLPRMMGRFTLTLGDDYELGEWYVIAIEVTMSRGRLATGEQRRNPETPALALMPTYWATLSRALP